MSETDRVGDYTSTWGVGDQPCGPSHRRYCPLFQWTLHRGGIAVVEALPTNDLWFFCIWHFEEPKSQFNGFPMDEHMKNTPVFPNINSSDSPILVTGAPGHVGGAATTIRRRGLTV